jgi:hypothetical protein
MTGHTARRIGQGGFSGFVYNDRAPTLAEVGFRRHTFRLASK